MAWKPDYVTSAVLKDYLEIDSADDDVFVALWVTAASRNVDNHCGRQFGKVTGPVTRVYRRPIWDRHYCGWVYTIDDLCDPADLAVVDEDGDAVTSWSYEPDNALADGEPYQRLVVTGRSCPGQLSLTSPAWGWTAVPSAVSVGLLLMAARLAARRGAPFGTAGSPSDGSEIRLLARLDPDMLTTLKPLRRKWFAV